MRKYLTKRLAVLLSVVMVVSLFANINWTVRAEENSIGAGNYTGNECWITADNSYDSILVPAECHLTIEGANVTATSVTIEEGGCIHIVDAGEGEGTKNGMLSIASDGLIVSDGAEIECGSNQNIPTVGGAQIPLYDGDDSAMNENSEWQMRKFRYTNSESVNKWYACPENGPEPGSLTVRYDGNDGGYVKWGEERINSDVPVSFLAPDSTEEQPPFKAINLTFCTPEDMEKTQILVRVNRTDFYNNGETFTIEDEYLNGLFGNSTASYFSTDESGNVTFTYNPSRDDAVDIEVIWLRPGGPQFNDNEYSVMYDPNGDAKVTVNGEVIGDCQKKEFSKDVQLNFTLTPPDFRQDQTPIVKIVIHDGDENTQETVWRSDFEDGNSHKITLENNTFSFTPTSEKGFEVFIDWSEYDAFGGTEGYPILVEVDCSGNGTIALQGVSEENKFVLNNMTKARFAAGTTEVVLSWAENSAPRRIVVDCEGGNEYTQISGASQEVTLKLDEWKFCHITVEFDNQGGGNNQYNFTRLQEELNGTYFAFGDINTSGTADADDLKYGVMRTLYDGFRVNEGRYQREGAALGLKEDFNKQDPTNLNANMEKLLDFASVETTPIAGDTISATDKSGVSHTFAAYKVTITISKLYDNRTDLTNFPGESEEATSLGEQPIVLTTKAYLIDMTNSDEQVIIKVKNQYFVRDAHSESGGNEDDLENFEGLNARALILVANYDKKEDIVVFGNYATMNETLSDETSDRFFASGFGSNGEMKYLGDKFVVMKPGFLGVTINGTGETNTPLAWSVESSLSIAETGVNSGKDTETDIYFGFDSVEIAPVTSTKVGGLGVDSISTVEVLDGIPENAVRVEAAGNGKYTVHFLSDYYDTVRIKVTYNTTNGTESGIMTLNRVGIMIQGGMTAGDSHTVNIFHGHDMGVTLDNDVYNVYKAANQDNGEYKYAYYATYYYPTDSNATSADTSLFVTYTYEDGSVERKLLESNYFTAATGGSVAMSDYILYMGDGSNAPVKVEAIAIPNVNPDGTINGAKLGAGKGVEGTFNIE